MIYKMLKINLLISLWPILFNYFHLDKVQSLKLGLSPKNKIHEIQMKAL